MGKRASERGMEGLRVCKCAQDVANCKCKCIRTNSAAAAAARLLSPPLASLAAPRNVAHNTGLMRQLMSLH